METGSQAGFRTPRALFQTMGNAFLSERDRWVHWLPAILGLGIGCYFVLPFEPPRWLTTFAFVMTALGTIVAVRRGWLISLPALLALCAFLGGAAVAEWRSHDVAAPVLERSLSAVAVEGVVRAVEPASRGPRVVVEKPKVEDLLPASTPHRIRLRLRADANEVRPGDRIDVLARLAPPPSASWPGGYDFSRQAWFERLGGVGFALSRTEIVPDGDKGGLGSRISTVIEELRVEIAQRIQAGISGSAGAVAAALATGLRGSIPEHVEASMRDSGLAHLLAISGLHVGLVAGFVFAAVRAGLALVPSLVLRHPVKKWAAIAALLAAGGYLMLAGATVPTQRAFVMTGFVLVAVILDRRGISLRLVAWAATIILVVRPEALLSVSFQMSFAAVIALVATYEAMAGRFHETRSRHSMTGRVALYFGAVALTTLVAGLATAPFAAFHFNRFALFGLVANLLAVPLAALVVMPLIVVTLLLMPFGLEAATLPLLGVSIEAILSIAGLVSSWPGAVGGIPEMPVVGLVFITAGGLWLCLWRRRWRLFGVIGIGAGIATIGSVPPPDILVSESSRLVALRSTDAQGRTVLFFSDGRQEAYLRDVWTRRILPDAVQTFPGPGEGDATMRCDSIGCVARLKDMTVSVISDQRALPDDCRLADVVIASVPVRSRCRGPAVTIDRFDVWRHGAHAVWLDKPEVWRSRGWEKPRPWVRAFSWSNAGNDDE